MVPFVVDTLTTFVLDNDLLSWCSHAPHVFNNNIY